MKTYGFMSTGRMKKYIITPVNYYKIREVTKEKHKNPVLPQK